MDNDSREYLEQFMKLTPSILAKIRKHCKKYGINEEVCAWYKDFEDFKNDWQGIGYTAVELRKIYHGGVGEFQTFPNGNIIRYVL